MVAYLGGIVVGGKQVGSSQPLPGIDWSHQQTHSGKMFVSGNRFVSVADNGYAYFWISIPAGYTAHTVYEIAATGKCYIDFYEGPTVSGGTAVTPANKNRASANTAHVSTKHGVTVSNAGTLIPQDGLIGSGDRHTIIGGSAGMANEFILDASTDYLIAVQNKSGGAADIAIAVAFYEVSI